MSHNFIHIDMNQAGPRDPLYGDVSGNNSIESEDALLAARRAVGLVDLNRRALVRADVTGDSLVTATDAAWIQRKVSGPSTVFPVER